jgi:putative membrane protein
MAAPDSWLSHERYPQVLFASLAAFSIVLAIAPHDRADWALENGLAVVAVAVLIATRKALPLSRISYTLIFVFLCLHTVGAHYTYSLVPYDAWLESLTGRTLSSLTGWERNHFDRLVHFGYGLLLAYPAREVFLRVADVRGFWGYYLPLDVVMATSMVYELIEWGAAVGFGGDLGVAYLGTQGDQWDAQKDMALASLGGTVAMLVTAAINWRYQRDFAREWADSLSVKRSGPLGEDALARLLSKVDE